MNANNLRKSLLGLTGALGAIGLQSCTTPQPAPECTTPTSSAALFVPPFAVLLTQTDTVTGDCAGQTQMLLGSQRYRTAPQGGDFKLGLKPSLLADAYLGYVYAGNIDDSNDCVNEEDCQGADDPEAACVVKLMNGDFTLNDGTPVAADGTVTPASGDPYQVDLENECMAVDDPVARADESDPDGKNLVLLGEMPQFPTNNICAVSNFSGGSQNFAAVDLLDGTQLPATTYKVEFPEFNVISNAKAAGTAFTGKMVFTVDSCVAHYDMKGFWSGTFVGSAFIPCVPDPMGEQLQYSPDCDPSPNPDAADAGSCERGGCEVFGSGISPILEPKCDKTLKVCVPTVDYANLTK